MYLSTHCLSYNLHCVLECLHALRQVINDLVLGFESLIHFVFELLSESSELSHSFSLELFNIFMLSLELARAFVLEHTELERLVSALLIDFLVEFILGVIHFLHYVLLSFDTGLHLAIELVLQV
jgi:hypothetical protein